MRKKQKLASTSGFVRIISGQWRGRKLPVLALEGLRPTTDRVKETLFNWLAPHIDEARVLDLFAGSGSLAFEALSRYASCALLCEKNKAAAENLLANLKRLDCHQAEVCCDDALVLLSKPCPQAYDVIFLDPPFRKGLIKPCLEALECNGWVKPGTLVYIEHEGELPEQEFGMDWCLLKQKLAGQTKFQLWVYQAPK
jgi:16S rRNA (guanine966-N2)-methyltransferase